MYSPRPMALLVCLFLLCAASASAQVRLGVYNSIKGLGLSTEIVSKSNSSENDNFTIYADSYGIFAGRTKTWGVMGNYRHEYSFYKADFEFLSFELHSGAGCFVGYVRDYEEGVFSFLRPDLVKRPGFCLGVSGCIGTRILFDRALSLDLSFSLDPGMHIRTDAESGNLMISMYNNGIYHFMYPELRLFYNF